MGERPDDPTGPARYVFDDLLVDCENYRVLKDGRRRDLGPRAFDLLVDLLRHAGRVVSKAELVGRVWNGAAVTDNALTRAVREAREAIGDDAGAPRYIETVARRGYRFIGSVRAPGSTERVMLVVLPVADLGGASPDYFCDGLTEELITRLAQVNAHQLGVIARTSSMAYRNTGKTIADIAAELGVHYVLESSVRRQRGRVRISAQLIEARGQTHIWADSYEDELGDVLKVQARVAEAVAEAIRIELQPGSWRPGPMRSVDPEAYAAYLRGRYLWNRRRADSIVEGMHAFQSAIDREPTFAPAHVGLARCCTSFFMGVLPRAEAQPMARLAVERSLELDDRLAEAHGLLGILKSVDGNQASAERSFRHAIALDPNDATAHHSYAMMCLTSMGRFDDALDELAIARTLDPLALIVAADVAAVHYLARDPESAAVQCRRVLDLDPTFARAHVYAGWVQAQRGEHADAVASFSTASTFDRSPWTMGWLGFGFGLAGQPRQAGQVLVDLRRASEGGCEVAFFEALVHIGLGETERALERLERACAERSLAFSIVGYMAAFDVLRHEPRFTAVLGRIAERGTCADVEPARGG